MGSKGWIAGLLVVSTLCASSISGAGSFESTTEFSSSSSEPSASSSPTPAPEEDDEEKKDELSGWGIAGLVVVLAVVVYYAWLRPKKAPAKAMTDDDRKAASYLRENETQLRIDLARGFGPTIDDVAAAYLLEPPRRAAFGAALRHRRAELIDVLDDRTVGDAQRVRAFLRRVGEVMREDDRLAADFDRWHTLLGVADIP